MLALLENKHLVAHSNQLKITKLLERCAILYTPRDNRQAPHRSKM